MKGKENQERVTRNMVVCVGQREWLALCWVEKTLASRLGLGERRGQVEGMTKDGELGSSSLVRSVHFVKPALSA